MHLDGGKIPTALDSRLHQLICYSLGEGRRHGDDANLDIPFPDNLPEILAVLHLHMVHHCADDMRILVEEGHQIEAQGHEVLIVGQSHPQMSYAYHRDVQMMVKAQDVPYEYVPDMKTLGDKAGLEIKTACAAVLRA